MTVTRDHQQNLEWEARVLGRLPRLSSVAEKSARDRQHVLTKPSGSLGRLEEVVIRLSRIMDNPLPSVERKAVIIFAADHGVAIRGVSAYPQAVTAQMVANFEGGGAAICAMCRVADAELLVADCGVKGRTAVSSSVLDVRCGDGTSDMSLGPAMSAAQARLAVQNGFELGLAQVRRGIQLLAVGEMGIANTTAASAITAVVCRRDVADVTGPGTGLSAFGVSQKTSIIRRALAVNRPNPTDPYDILAKIGGFEIATMAGAIVAAAQGRVPVVLDGFVTGAAAIIAERLAPGLADFMLAAHLSPEPGHRVQLEQLKLEPLLDLHLRLGEGTGAVLSMPIIETACRIHAEMSTFREAGVENRA